MDFRARDQTWRALISNTVQDDTEGCSVGSDRNIQDVINKFKDLLRKSTRIWWNHAFLEQYLQKDLIPRGLRVQVFPSFPIEDEAFKIKWEALTNTCSRGFLELLKNMNQESLTSLEVEIDELQVTLRRDMTADALKKLNEEMDSLSQKWANEIQATKTKKFQRDVEDKRLSRVYRWRNSNERSRPQFRGSSYSRSRSTSIKSNFSGDEELISKNPKLSGASGGTSSFKRTTRQTAKSKINSGMSADSQGGLQVVNLSSYKLTDFQLKLLSKGFSFSPTNSFHFFTAVKDLHLFSRKLLLKKLHHKRNSCEPMSETERETLQNLEDLLDEQRDLFKEFLGTSSLRFELDLQYIYTTFTIHYCVWEHIAEDLYWAGHAISSYYSYHPLSGFGEICRGPILGSSEIELFLD
ncbi:uncharacterized protein LOC143793041 [Ranitomeya variabilis]|uniref:uncharacterized protein LOC143793041 n=1 Tax=Ranitomeya variabilis TaxID=490064 RepID=UPI004056C4EB